MNNTTQSQKKNKFMNYVYITIVSMIVIACVATIALVSADKPTNTTGNVAPGESIAVSTTTYVLPMKNAVIQKDYSGTELQYNDTMKQWEIHKAIDFKATDNANVYAISNGTVTNVYTNYLEGTVVEIDHKDGIVSVYKSLDGNVNVKIGDKVTAGFVIGNAGITMAQESNSGEHLHFEMLVNGVKVDPNNYISLGDK